jgi:hypothetical protein
MRSALPKDQLSLDPRFLRQAPRLRRAAERLSGLTLSAVEQFADRLATREYWLEDQTRVRRTMSERSGAGFSAILVA